MLIIDFMTCFNSQRNIYALGAEGKTF